MYNMPFMAKHSREFRVENGYSLETFRGSMLVDFILPINKAINSSERFVIE